MILQQSNYSGSLSAFVETLELTDGVTTLRYVFGDVDVTAGGYLYTALPMDSDSLASPAQDDDGAQEITLSLDNIDGQLALFVYAMNRNKRSGTVTRRTFDESNLATPLIEYSMSIKDASYTISNATITCGYMNVLDLAWPRRTYNLIDFPGIRYL